SAKDCVKELDNIQSIQLKNIKQDLGYGLNGKNALIKEGAIIEVKYEGTDKREQRENTDLILDEKQKGLLSADTKEPISYSNEYKKREAKRVKTKDGKLSKKVLNLWPDADKDIIDGPFVYVDLELSSRQNVIDLLLQNGWKPNADEYNISKNKEGKYKKTNPK